MGRRSAHAERVVTIRRPLPEPGIPLTSEEARTHYRVIMMDVPQSKWELAAVRLLAAQAAEISTQLTRLNRVVDEEGVTTTTAAGGAKAHPALSQFANLASKLASLLTKLRVVPQGDARDLRREARYEALHRERAAAQAATDDSDDLRHLIAGYGE